MDHYFHMVKHRFLKINWISYHLKIIYIHINIMFRYFLFCLSCLPLFQSLKLSGVTKPTGFFDPLGFSHEKSDSELLWLREAELKHGRWGMIASLAIPAFEVVNHQPGIHSLDKSSPLLTGCFVTAVAASEYQSMLNGWKNPFDGKDNYFQLKEDYNPGDFNLGIRKEFLGKDEKFMADAELNHGRLAMIGASGMIAQELATGNTLF